MDEIRKSRRKKYLPRGVRSALANHFSVSEGAIDKRILNNDPETVELAAKMVQDYNKRKRNAKLLKEAIS